MTLSRAYLLSGLAAFIVVLSVRGPDGPGTWLDVAVGMLYALGYGAVQHVEAKRAARI